MAGPPSGEQTKELYIPGFTHFLISIFPAQRFGINQLSITFENEQPRRGMRDIEGTVISSSSITTTLVTSAKREEPSTAGENHI